MTLARYSSSAWNIYVAAIFATAIILERRAPVKYSIVLAVLRSMSAFEGKKGVALRAVSAAEGKTLKEYRLDGLPVHDGMAGAYGRLYMAAVGRLGRGGGIVPVGCRIVALSPRADNQPREDVVRW